MSSQSSAQANAVQANVNLRTLSRAYAKGVSSLKWRGFTPLDDTCLLWEGPEGEQCEWHDTSGWSMQAGELHAKSLDVAALYAGIQDAQRAIAKAKRKEGDQ